MDAELEGAKVTIGGEVAQQIGEGKVRVVCMKATDGLTRVRWYETPGAELQFRLATTFLDTSLTS